MRRGVLEIFRMERALARDFGKNFWRLHVEMRRTGLTVCAERLANFKAISEGRTRFDAIAVVRIRDALTPPCGCVPATHLGSFAGDVPVISFQPEREDGKRSMKALFPKAVRCDESLGVISPTIQCCGSANRTGRKEVDS